MELKHMNSFFCHMHDMVNKNTYIYLSLFIFLGIFSLIRDTTSVIDSTILQSVSQSTKQISRVFTFYLMSPSLMPLDGVQCD